MGFVIFFLTSLDDEFSSSLLCGLFILSIFKIGTLPFYYNYYGLSLFYEFFGKVLFVYYLTIPEGLVGFKC